MNTNKLLLFLNKCKINGVFGSKNYEKKINETSYPITLEQEYYGTWSIQPIERSIADQNYLEQLQQDRLRFYHQLMGNII